MVSWNALKECMRARFVPPSRKEHLLKFQRLPQGHRMIEDYFQDFETTLTKMNMHANEESKIKWFVRGLRRDIRELIELNEYSSLKKVFRQAIKVESYLLKSTFKNTHDDMISTTLLGRMPTKFLLKILLPIFPNKPCFQTKFLLQIFLLLSHLPKLQISNVLNV